MNGPPHPFPEEEGNRCVPTPSRGRLGRGWDLRREIPKQVRNDIVFLVMLLNLGLMKIRLVSASHLLRLYYS
jgi:hypothetical protein